MRVLKELSEPRPETTEDTAEVLPFTPLVHLQHLLKVADSITVDANRTWAEIWEELKNCATLTGAITPQAEKGFVPSCGWPELLEKIWLLKHYIDSIQRICETDR